jgi:hypothetical protein
MIQAGIPDKYSFHMQVSARPIGSFFGADRLILKLPTRLAFGAIYQRVTFRMRASAETRHYTRRCRLDGRFTKALRSTTYQRIRRRPVAIGHGYARIFKRYLPRSDGSITEAAHGACRLVMRERSGAWHFPIERRNTK